MGICLQEKGHGGFFFYYSFVLSSRSINGGVVRSCMRERHGRGIKKLEGKNIRKNKFK